MLNDVYAPKTVADLAWSRQKSVALSSFIRDIRGGAGGAPDAHTARILLLYGPPGCGKLESLKVLLQEDYPATSASTASKTLATPVSVTTTPKTPTSFNVFHTCEATVTAYAQFLQNVISLCSGQLVGSTLSLTSLGAPGGDEEWRGASPRTIPTNTAFGSATLSKPSQHANIIKFYGEPASHPLHRCTAVFVREYEGLCRQAFREDEQQRQIFGATPNANALLAHLRRNLVFFVHTTHDSHNDKLDLSSSFPSAVLQSSVVERFHCTPVTEINLKKRLKCILELEARRRVRASAASCSQEVTNVDDLFAAAPNVSGSAVRQGSGAARGGGASKGRRGKQKAAIALAPAKPSSSFSDVLDSATLDAIAAGSQGDIRQALLQVQWAALVPPGTARSEEARAHSAASQGLTAEREPCEADVVWARLQLGRALARSRTENSSSGTFEGLLQYVATDDVATHGSTSSARGLVQNGQEVVTSEDDLVLLVSSGSSESGDSSPILSASPAGQKKSRVSEQLATHKRARSPRNDAISITPAARGTDMLSLLDSQMDAAHLPATIPPQSRGAGKVGSKKNGRRAASLSPNADEFDPAVPSTQVEHRSVLPTTRDEYLGLSHATGRLLTQKYSIDEVLDILNVPPRKMLDYLTNNQIRYFSDKQLPQYAACATAASEADALRTSEFGGSFAGGVSAAALRERRQLADRTTAGENEGNTARLLDVIALQTFHRSYLVGQKEVHAPPGFAAQEPPPFLRSAYPRIRDVDSTISAPGKPPAAVLTDYSEQEWTQQFLLRLESPLIIGSSSSSALLNSRRRPLAGGVGGGNFTFVSAGAASPRVQMNEVDILREALPDLLLRCGCTESVVTEYYALAPYIVLNLQSPAALSSGRPASLPSTSFASSPSSTPSEAANTKREASVSFSLKQEPHSSFSSAPSPAAAPRRTVFKFAAASPPPPPATSTIDSSSKRDDVRYRCTSLQLKILQRGRDCATATLREDHFTLMATEDFAEEGTMEDGGAVDERPWMPEGEDIEDD